MRSTFTCVAMLLMAMSQGFAAESGALPPGENEAKARLDKSPRHGEWVEVEVPGSKTPLKSYIVYPEVKEKAPELAGK